MKVKIATSLLHIKVRCCAQHHACITKSSKEPCSNMAPYSILSLAWLLFASTVTALMGFEGDAYSPLCAHGCLGAFSAPMLTCSTPDDPISGMMVLNMMTRPECFAENEPYLTSMAYCIGQECAPFRLTSLQLETFWATQATGDTKVPPKWGYAQTLAKVTEPPTDYLMSGMDSMLHRTMLANQSTMTLQKNTLYSVGYESRLEG